MERIDVGAVVWLQSLFGEQSWHVWNVITELGTPPVYMVVIGFLFWQGRRSVAMTALIAVLITGLLVEVLKVLLAIPRPYYAFEMVSAWRESSGFGMPSAHAAGTMTLGLMIAVLIRRYWLTGIAMILIVLVGLSRMYFGVHSVAQVLCGWLLAVAVVYCVLRLRHRAVDWFAAVSPIGLLLTGVASLMLLTGFQQFVVQSIAENFTVPSLWIERFNQAVAFEDRLDGEQFKAKPLTLFHGISLPAIGTITGFWMLLAWLRQHHESLWADRPIKRYLLSVNTLTGLLIVVLLTNLLAATENIPLLNFVVWSMVPLMVVQLVPYLSFRLARRLNLPIN
ncbi:MAG: phosphatase PAP2 family protein [Granulosicoccus sp.]|nr:phosphatase PAP2 family protein [Granulosicoccus sp.]